MIPMTYPYRGLLDENGVPYGVKHINNKPRVSSMPYLYDIAEGNVPNHTAWSKDGYNGTVGTSEETMWAGSDGLYPFLAAETQLTVESTNELNDIATGTGARTVYVYYLDDAFAPKVATATLHAADGRTPVNLSASDVYRIQNFRVATCGAVGKPVGSLSLKAGGVTYGFIAAGYNKARTCVWTVPAGKILYITSIMYTCAGTKYVRFTNRATYDNASSTVLAAGMFMGYTEAMLLNGVMTKELELPTRLPAGVDLKVDVLAEAAGSLCSCQLRGWYETA
jgi:hypothetical protein